MKRSVRKAVFPVAGMGTRFLPATKANPKEMLPIVDKPLIQYAAEEAVEAGMTHLIFINGRAKRSIPDHFDKAYELEAELEARGKTELLRKVQGILPEGVACIYMRQAEPLGLGHAVALSEPVVGNEPFAVILADDLIACEGKNTLRQMQDVFEEKGASVLGVEEVDPQDTEKYGIVSAEPMGGGLFRVRSIVEKPKPKDAPSNLGVVGRYILTPRIFQMLSRMSRGAGGEIQLTDAIARLLEEEPVYAYRFSGRRYDCGSKLGYLQACVEFGLCHEEVGQAFGQYLDGFCKRRFAWEKRGGDQ